MNEREADIIAAFAHLKTMCDPRGHSLLRLLEDLALDRVRDVPSNVIPLDTYSRKVLADPLYPNRLQGDPR